MRRFQRAWRTGSVATKSAQELTRKLLPEPRQEGWRNSEQELLTVGDVRQALAGGPDEQEVTHFRDGTFPVELLKATASRKAPVAVAVSLGGIAWDLLCQQKALLLRLVIQEGKKSPDGARATFSTQNWIGRTGEVFVSKRALTALNLRDNVVELPWPCHMRAEQRSKALYHVSVAVS